MVLWRSSAIFADRWTRTDNTDCWGWKKKEVTSVHTTFEYGHRQRSVSVCVSTASCQAPEWLWDCSVSNSWQTVHSSSYLRGNWEVGMRTLYSMLSSLLQPSKILFSLFVQNSNRWREVWGTGELERGDYGFRNAQVWSESPFLLSCNMILVTSSVCSLHCTMAS